MKSTFVFSRSLMLNGVFAILALLQATDIHAQTHVTQVPGSDNQWPMSGGPDGTWKVKTDQEIPTKWSVRNNQNIKWKKTLPEGGQSGIAIWDDKIFLTINPPNDNASHDVNSQQVTDKKTMKASGISDTRIVLLCLDANTGQSLWSQTIEGTMPSSYHYGFSDSTTPCPATDGSHVWAINSSGGMACFTLAGEKIWSRTWKPTGGRPFNKQFDSILFRDLILNVEPPAGDDATREQDWNYLHAFDKKTGQRIWVTTDAITHYNAPCLGTTSDGTPAALIGRGGPHGVPERPVGLSLISLADGQSGSAIWRWEPEEPNNLSGWGALSTQHWDADKASWFLKTDYHLTIDTKTGKLSAKKQLKMFNQYSYDEANEAYSLKENVVPKKKRESQRHCNMLAGDHLYYMVRYQPFLARHNIVTGVNEHLEVPREFNADGKFIWKTEQSNDGLNSKGQRQGNDIRTLGGGFQKCFLGSPTMINQYLFFTNAIGMVYVVDTTAEQFDQSALVAVNDLGEPGKTWTVNSLSFSNGHIYHRTMKEIICIGE